MEGRFDLSCIIEVPEGLWGTPIHMRPNEANGVKPEGSCIGLVLFDDRNGVVGDDFVSLFACFVGLDNTGTMLATKSKPLVEPKPRVEAGRPRAGHIPVFGVARAMCRVW